MAFPDNKAVGWWPGVCLAVGLSAVYSVDSSFEDQKFWSGFVLVTTPMVPYVAGWLVAKWRG